MVPTPWVTATATAQQPLLLQGDGLCFTALSSPAALAVVSTRSYLGLSYDSPLRAPLPPGKENFLRETLATSRSQCLEASPAEQRSKLTARLKKEVQEAPQQQAATAESSSELMLMGDKLQQEPDAV